MYPSDWSYPISDELSPLDEQSVGYVTKEVVDHYHDIRLLIPTQFPHNSSERVVDMRLAE